MYVNPRYRQQYHFMAEAGWINDPNGFIQVNDTYHLFYQHHPNSSEWGPMHWGHATSKNLTTWEHQKIALTPQEPYDQLGCFSGSAHFEKGQLYLYYTGNTDVQTQCLAVSNNFQDFDKYIGNPVINIEHIPEHIDPTQHRDPKFIQQNGSNYLLMGALTRDGHGTIAVFKGQNLTEFEYQFSLGDENHRIGTMWECPDLMTLAQQDVLIFSPQYTDRDPQHDMPNLHSAVYSVGVIDLEHQAYSLSGFHLIDHGFDFYAPQTLQDQEGRRILIAWMDMWESDNVTHRLGHGWSGCMTYPRELSLENNRLVQCPVRELESLRQLKSQLSHLEVNSQHFVLSPFPVYDAILKITAASKAVYKLVFHDTMTLTHDPVAKHLLINRNGQQRQLHYDKDVLELRILSDVSSVELFIDDGHITFSARVFAPENEIPPALVLQTEGNCTIIEFSLYALTGL